MTKPNEATFQDDETFERRSKQRTVINRDALMFFTGSEAVHSCCVLNVTNDGARIKLNGLNVLPFDFGVSFDRFRTMRKCRMIWREGDFHFSVQHSKAECPLGGFDQRRLLVVTNCSQSYASVRRGTGLRRRQLRKMPRGDRPRGIFLFGRRDAVRTKPNYAEPNRQPGGHEKPTGGMASDK